MKCANEEQFARNELAAIRQGAASTYNVEMTSVRKTDIEFGWLYIY